jgi:hypothetical protein
LNRWGFTYGRKVCELNLKHAKVLTLFLLDLNQIGAKGIDIIQSDILGAAIHPALKRANLAGLMGRVVLNCQREGLSVFGIFDVELYEDEFSNQSVFLDL